GMTPKQARPSDYTLVRLAQAAGRTKQYDELADTFVKAINKDDYRAWAKAVALQAALATQGDKIAEEKGAEIPANPKDYRVGQAWGRMAVARQNAKATGRYDVISDIDLDRWGKGFKPFGQAGLILGLQDRAGK